jgi:integrase
MENGEGAGKVLTGRDALLCLTPKELERMARREYQDPPLKKTKGKNPQWYIRVRKRVIVAGKGLSKQQSRIYLGDCSEVGMREANRIRAEKLKEINGEVYTISSKILLEDFLVAYNNKHLPTLGKAAQAKYRSLIVNHIASRFAKRQLSQIGTEDIQDFLNGKKTDGLSWWTRNDLRNVLSSIFTQAEAWGYWKERNPVENTKLPREKAKREKRLLTDEQVSILLSELPADVALMIRLADSTGMRISEIIGLRWRNVNLETGWLQVCERTYRGEDGPTKTENSERSLPLANLVGDFREHARKVDAKPEDYVFRHPVTGEAYDDRNLNQHFLRKIAKRHGFYFEGFGFHSFRRATLTGVQESGGSTIEAQQIAGHSRPSTTSLYTVLQEKRKEDLVRSRQNRFLKLVKSA